MNEQDYKYLIAAYQQKTLEIFSQLIVAEAKNRQLNDVNEALSAKINEQKKEIEKLSAKPKRVSKEEEFQ
jgi:predicted RNase H-like nuclease (RuvC/YqgF family)